MNQDVVLGLAREALWVSLLVGGPILGISLVVGVVVSILQAVTQVNEQSLAFVPKVVAVFAGVILFGPWMLETLVAFSAGLFSNMGSYGR
ncbi:MAG: flagellar biosynthesis protein FliQ [Dehalococcoidia bacterium]